jgi:hypothetical protein
MTKAGVPQLQADDNDMAARRHVMWNGVEVSVAIAPKENHLGLEILNRKNQKRQTRWNSYCHE